MRSKNRCCRDDEPKIKYAGRTCARENLSPASDHFRGIHRPRDSGSEVDLFSAPDQTMDECVRLAFLLPDPRITSKRGSNDAQVNQEILSLHLEIANAPKNVLRDSQDRSTELRNTGLERGCCRQLRSHGHEHPHGHQSLIVYS